jgi:hypothetical protein
MLAGIVRRVRKWRRRPPRWLSADVRLVAFASVATTSIRRTATTRPMCTRATVRLEWTGHGQPFRSLTATRKDAP